MFCEYFKVNDVHSFRRKGITNYNVIKYKKIAPNHLQQLCNILFSDKKEKYHGNKRKKQEDDNGTKFPKDAKKILSIYINKEEMGMSIDSTKDSSQFTYLCCYLAYFVITLRSIAFFGVAINYELVIVYMCNCVNAWT